MGATHTTLASSTEDATRSWIETLDYAIDERLYPGSGRMMRTFRLSHKTTGSLVVAKSMWTTSHDLDQIKAQQAELARIKEALQGQSHVAPFFFWNLGSPILQQQMQVRPVALVRNHVYTTLSDRLESRPFLTNVEKLYIIHQLLSALQAMHDAKVLHGFLTTENVCLTSWNYVVIVDIASYKARTALPDDDPSEYLYYFQEFHKQQESNTQREKRCYLAPERFYSPKSSMKPEEDTHLTPSMDVFSAGCIVLETWLNGERALDLGDLMDYRNEQSFPPSLQQKFQKIESSSLRAACRHMLHLDPAQRLSPAEYLERLQDIIPSTISESLEPLMERFTNDVSTPDARMALAAAYYHKILFETVGVEDNAGKSYFCNLLGPTLCRLEQLIEEEGKENEASEDLFDADKLLRETEALLKKLETLDFDEATDDGAALDEPSGEANSDQKTTTKSTTSRDSLLIFVQLVLANLRHVTRPSSKLVALQLLSRLGEHSSDETRLQRVVPSTIYLLQDQDPLVRAVALKVMTTTLSQIQSFPPSDSKIFPQYVFKRVAHLLTDPCLVVRIAFSECISILAETSRRFLDISHAVRLYEAVGGGGSTGITDKIKVSSSASEFGVFDDDIAKLLDGPANKDGEEGRDGGALSTSKGVGALHTLIANTYDAEVSALHEVVSRWVVHITTSEQSSSPKEALLGDLARLCNFFGRDGVMAFVLPQILAFLNDRRDWQLRAALFEDLPSACFIIGRAATEHFVLPCLETALVDSEDQVLRSALMCLTTLVDLDLLSRSVLVDTRGASLKDQIKRGALFDRYCPLLLFPATDVRYGAILFVNACCKAFGSPDAEVFLVPILRPYLRFEPSKRHLTTVEGLEKCLVAPWTKDRLTDGLMRAVRAARGDKMFPDPHEPECDTLMTEYLKMLYRSRMSKGETSDVKSKLATAIEGSLKLSQSVKFPVQTAAGSLDKPIPQWFGNARCIAKDGSRSASEFSSLQSVAALNQVYGLSIMEGDKKTPDVPEDVATADKLNHSEEHLVNYMKTDKAKQIDASVMGEWGAECVLDTSLDTTTNLVGKLQGLGVPTLSPRLGTVLDNGPSKENLSKGMGDWRPKIETLIASTSPVGGHSGPVSRLAVSQDQRFFVSGSYDTTCRVWELGKIDSSSGIMDSSATYTGHNEGDSIRPARVNDIALLESSHSVASASSDGNVHVWRVDLVTSKLSSQSTAVSGTTSDYSRVSGSSVVRTVDSSKEGEVLAVSHFNTLSESVLTFATQRGSVHSWDLRSEKEPFELSHPAELGYLTSMALGTDRNWIVTGTSKGFIALWDIRWKNMVKLWHHPSADAINRLATSYAPVPSARANSSPKPLLFVSSGSECGMFDIMDGACRQGFHVLGPKRGVGMPQPRVELTSLKEIDVSTTNLSSRLRSQGLLQKRDSTAFRGPQMNAMVGSIGGYDQNYLITGGGDAHIRYWDFATPSKCYTVSGQVGSQHRPNYERVDFPGSNRLMVCRQTTGLRLQDLESSRVPRRLQRGLIRAESRHQDAILDLKLIQSPIKAVVSCSRDGSIKLFK